MGPFAVTVTAHNNAAVLPRALGSVEDALAFLRDTPGPARTADAEVVVVDDGSTDGTPELLRDLTAGKGFYRILRRPTATSPSAARNAGADASRGALLFFLDADDFYLPSHLHDCLTALADPPMQFAKTGVRLADPVHPDWQARIEHSIVINLCVRRACHAAIGGFLDYHLFARDGDGFRHELDVFYKVEDQYYNELLARLYPGVGIRRQTVEHVRYPGNSFDRQYEKFRRPFGSYREALTPEQRFRLELCDVLFRHRLESLRAGAASPRGPGPDGTR
jgi:glycosyltransferase involved in cell wall biosynthesis